MSETPRFLYFDLGNVLFNFDHSRVCRQLAEVSGLPVGDTEAYVAKHDLHLRLEIGEISPRQAFDEFCTRMQVAPTFDQVMTAISDIFWINDAILPLITRLTMASTRMAILSNTNWPHWNFLQQQDFPILAYFDFAALSYEINSMKPDVAIYRAAEEMAGASGAEIFFTDDRQENVDGALAAGWQAELYTSVHKLEHDLRSRGVQFS